MYYGAVFESKKEIPAYYLSGNTWFSPACGANGVHYTVVPLRSHQGRGGFGAF